MFGICSTFRRSQKLEVALSFIADVKRENDINHNKKNSSSIIANKEGKFHSYREQEKQINYVIVNTPPNNSGRRSTVCVFMFYFQNLHTSSK